MYTAVKQLWSIRGPRTAIPILDGPDTRRGAATLRKNKYIKQHRSELTFLCYRLAFPNFPYAQMGVQLSALVSRRQIKPPDPKKAVFSEDALEAQFYSSVMRCVTSITDPQVKSGEIKPMELSILGQRMLAALDEICERELPAVGFHEDVLEVFRTEHALLFTQPDQDSDVDDGHSFQSQHTITSASQEQAESRQTTLRHE